MKVDAVFDVGNTSVKVARCLESGFGPATRLPHSKSDWSELSFLESSVRKVAIAGVVPSIIDQLVKWAIRKDITPSVIAKPSEIPIRINTLQPDSVGTDRLFDALAASRRYPGKKIIVVDAGTAITINLVSPEGAFEGGAIMPGLALMAKALNEQTALLPIVQIDGSFVFPGKDTVSNIQTGILASAVGAIDRITSEVSPDVTVFTGSDGAVLHKLSNATRKELIPTLTLEGIRFAAESLP